MTTIRFPSSHLCRAADYKPPFHCSRAAAINSPDTGSDASWTGYCNRTLNCLWPSFILCVSLPLTLKKSYFSPSPPLWSCALYDCIESFFLSSPPAFTLTLFSSRLLQTFPRAVWKAIHDAQEHAEALRKPRQLLRLWPPLRQHGGLLWRSGQLPCPLYGEFAVVAHGKASFFTVYTSSQAQAAAAAHTYVILHVHSFANTHLVSSSSRCVCYLARQKVRHGWDNMLENYSVTITAVTDASSPRTRRFSGSECSEPVSSLTESFSFVRVHSFSSPVCSALTCMNSPSALWIPPYVI